MQLRGNAIVSLEASPIIKTANANLYFTIITFLWVSVSSQCILVKTMMTKNPTSVASRLAIQMNAKLGGEPWAVDIPLKVKLTTNSIFMINCV